MTFTEKFTWGNKELIVKRETSPVDIVSAESKQVKLEKIDVADPRLRPTNFDKPEGTIKAKLSRSRQKMRKALVPFFPDWKPKNKMSEASYALSKSTAVIE